MNATETMLVLSRCNGTFNIGAFGISTCGIGTSDTGIFGTGPFLTLRTMPDAAVPERSFPGSPAGFPQSVHVAAAGRYAHGSGPVALQGLC